MKVESITIQGMHKVFREVYSFGDFNYLMGPNAAGKSTVMQALQLALLGYIPGTDKKKSAIFRHANGPVMSVYVILRDSESEIHVRRTWARAGKDISASLEVEPEGYDISGILSDLELPIFNFNEFVGMTANKLKDWFIEFLPKTNVELDWAKELSSCVTVPSPFTDDLVADSCRTISSYNLSGVDEIRAANQYFKQMVSLRKAEVDRIGGTLQSLVYYDDVDMSASEESIRDALMDYKRKELAQAKLEQIEISNRRVQQTLNSYSDCSFESFSEDPRYIEAKADVSSIQDSLTNLMNEPVPDTSEIQMMIQDIMSEIKSKRKVISGQGTCPFTNEKCEQISELIERYTTEISVSEEEVKSLSEKVDSIRASRDEKSRKINEVRQQLQSASKLCEDIRERYARRDILRDQIQPISDYEREDYTAAIESLNDKLAKYKANKQYNSVIESLTKSKFEADTALSLYKSWVNLTGVNGLQSGVGDDNPFAILEGAMKDRIHLLFGDDVSPRFNVESKANSFSFGIVRGLNYIPYDLLSSGEKCMYALALMMSIVDDSKSSLKLIMVDDLFDHLDDNNIKTLFDSLYSVKDIQMIFAGVKCPDVEDKSIIVRI